MKHKKDYQPQDFMFFQSTWEKIMYHLDKLKEDREVKAILYDMQCQVEVAKMNDKWV